MFSSGCSQLRASNIRCQGHGGWVCVKHECLCWRSCLGKDRSESGRYRRGQERHLQVEEQAPVHPPSPRGGDRPWGSRPTVGSAWPGDRQSACPEGWVARRAWHLHTFRWADHLAVGASVWFFWKSKPFWFEFINNVDDIAVDYVISFFSSREWWNVHYWLLLV